MAYQETTTTGYGQRVGRSFRGIGSGILLFIAGTVFLWVNEGRAVKTDRMLREAEGVTLALPTVETVDPAMDGKLVWASGTAATGDILSDPLFGVRTNAVKLQRKVEYYQWIEESHSEKKDKVGGKQETVTTYTYHEGWTSSPIESSRFHDPDYQDKNFVLANPEGETWYASNVTLGAFTLSDSQIRSFSGDGLLAPEVDSTKLAALSGEVNARLASIKGWNTEGLETVRQNSAGSVYIGMDPSSPSIGDVRVSWTQVLPGVISLVAKQSGSTFVPYTAKNGKTFSALRMGSHDADEIFSGAKSSNKAMTWILRLFGLILVVMGLKGVFDFLSTLLKVVPFLSNIVGWGVSAVCWVVGIAWSLIVAAIAWVAYRPVLAVAMMAVAAALVWVFAFKGKDKLREIAAKAGDKAPVNVPENKEEA